MENSWVAEKRNYREYREQGNKRAREKSCKIMAEEIEK